MSERYYSSADDEFPCPADGGGMCVAPVNQSPAPSPLAGLSPTSGPNGLVFQCPQSGGGRRGASSSWAENPRPKKPCDVDTLAITVFEHEGGSQKFYTYDTGKLSAGIRSKRPRDDLTPDSKAPARIQALLRNYDIVVEARGLEPGRTMDYPAQQGPIAQDRAANSNREITKSRAQGTVSAALDRPTQCGDAAHVGMTLDVAGLSKNKGVSFKEEIQCRPLRDVLPRLMDFVMGGFDPRFLAAEHKIEATSCGVDPGSPETQSLKALVTAYPPGMSGVKVGFGPLFLEFGWGSADAEANNAAKREVKGKLAEHQRTSAALSANAAAFRDVPGRDGRSARRQIAHKLGKIEKKEGKLRSRLWELRGAEPEFELAAVLFDREISYGELKSYYDNIRTALTILRTANTIRAGVMQLLDFVKSVQPGVVQPLAKIDVAIGGLDLSGGFMMTSNDKLEGDRWRALERFFDIDVTFVVLDISGGIGFMAGKSAWGTGAIAEFMFTLTGGLALDAEGKCTLGLDGTTDSWTDNIDGKLLGSIGATVRLDGRVTAANFHIANFAASVSGAVRCNCVATLSDMLKGKVTVTAMCDPLIANVDTSAGGGVVSKRWSCVMWQGTKPGDEIKLVDTSKS